MLQPAPALDLVLADPSNPRGLAFQLEAIEMALREIAGGVVDSSTQEVKRLSAMAEGITRCLLAATDQAEAATTQLPPLLRGMAADLATLSDQVCRRYFALLPPAHAVGVDVREAAVILA